MNPRKLQLDLRRCKTEFLTHAGERSINLMLWGSNLALLAGCFLFVHDGYHAGFTELNALATRLPEPLWQMITFMGDTSFALCLMLFFARRYPASLWIVFIAALYGGLAVQLTKHFFAEARPAGFLSPEEFNLLGHALSTNSFPSGHSLTIFALIGTLFYFLQEASTRAYLCLLAILVAVSRVVVGAHWPVDVLVGAAMGFACAILAIYTAKIWHWGFTLTGHSFVLALIVITTSLIYFSDGGYPLAHPFGILVATSALGFATYDYFWASSRRPRLVVAKKMGLRYQ